MGAGTRRGSDDARTNGLPGKCAGCWPHCDAVVSFWIQSPSALWHHCTLCSHTVCDDWAKTNSTFITVHRNITRCILLIFICMAKELYVHYCHLLAGLCTSVFAWGFVQPPSVLLAVRKPRQLHDLSDAPPPSGRISVFHQTRLFIKITIFEHSNKCHKTHKPHGLYCVFYKKRNLNRAAYQRSFLHKHCNLIFILCTPYWQPHTLAIPDVISFYKLMC